MALPILKEDQIHDYEEDAGSATGCGCFRLLGFKRLRRNQNDGDRRRLCEETTWWVKKMNQVRELSEVLAGPRWKTFIRKVGGYCKGKKQSKGRYQYDPQSYALNFDCDVNVEADDGPLLDFSSK